MSRDVSEGKLTAEVIVVGGGLIGLASAVALAERGISTTLIGDPQPGAASPAAAGMLAPSVERASGSTHEFAIAARDRYPAFLDFLAERTGIRVPLNRLGILQLAVSEKGVRGLRKSPPPGSMWLDAKELHSLEPALAHGLGAVLNPLDGAVDNRKLLEALSALAASHAKISSVWDWVISVSPGTNSCSVRTGSGATYSARRVVVAAGAWAGQIEGAPFARSVSPSRGQLVSYSSIPLRHVVYGPGGYVVPRTDATIGGSTMEDVGFDWSTTDAGIAKVRAAAEEICPVLAASSNTTTWAGLRPVTPDLLPIIGPDPSHESVLYACGHSRNGVLMAPLTGDIIADLVTATPLSYELNQFRPDRF
ncbi:MAG TPA: FAD-dependent oxidoreductase [Gemmatimonadaceae bacterium]|nr:FAD-dependent oxidoreductase [Gemmatimonadaceae bacterium]